VSSDGSGTKAAELRELTDEELVAKLREAKEELFNLRFQAATGQLDNHGRLRSSARTSPGSTRSCVSASSGSGRSAPDEVTRRASGAA
jgi:ribosomal protein L29